MKGSATVYKTLIGTFEWNRICHSDWGYYLCGK